MRMTDDLSPRAGVMEAVPTAFGYIGVGIAFGIIAKANGFSLLEILLLSMVTYGGSAQFIMVSMMRYTLACWPFYSPSFWSIHG